MDARIELIETLIAGGGLVFERAVSSGSALYGSVTDLDVRAHMDSAGLADCSLVMEPSVLKSIGKFSVSINGISVPLEIVEPKSNPRA